MKRTVHGCLTGTPQASANAVDDGLAGRHRIGTDTTVICKERYGVVIVRAPRALVTLDVSEVVSCSTSGGVLDSFSCSVGSTASVVQPPVMVITPVKPPSYVPPCSTVSGTGGLMLSA